MRRTTILNAAEVKKTSYKEAQSSYFKHCRLRNLRPQTIAYYKEDTDYFQAKTGVKYISDVTQEVFDECVSFTSPTQRRSQISLAKALRAGHTEGLSFLPFRADREKTAPAERALPFDRGYAILIANRQMDLIAKPAWGNRI